MKKENSNPQGKWKEETERNDKVFRLHNGGLSFKEISELPEMDFGRVRAFQIYHYVKNKRTPKNETNS